MLKAGRTLETRRIVQQCAQQHILPTMFAYRPKEGNTQLLNSRQRNQGYQKTWSAQRIQTISTTRISSTLAEHDRGLSIQFVTKLRDPWPSENTETQKPSHTEGRKTTPTLTECLDRADTLQKYGCFHILPVLEHEVHELMLVPSSLSGFAWKVENPHERGHPQDKIPPSSAPAMHRARTHSA